MDDSISRQAALVAIRNLYPDMPRINVCGSLHKWQEKNKQYIECEEAIYKLPSAQPEKVCIAVITMPEEQIREAVEKAKSEIIQLLSTAQPELIEKVEDILAYLDTELHPIVAPEHWNVYSELYDMISTLPIARSEQKKGKWIDKGDYCVCDQCGHTEQQYNGIELIPRHTPFCAMCGASMKEENTK